MAPYERADDLADGMLNKQIAEKRDVSEGLSKQGQP